MHFLLVAREFRRITDLGATPDFLTGCQDGNVARVAIDHPG